MTRHGIGTTPDIYPSAYRQHGGSDSWVRPDGRHPDFVIRDFFKGTDWEERIELMIDADDVGGEVSGAIWRLAEQRGEQADEAMELADKARGRAEKAEADNRALREAMASAATSLSTDGGDGYALWVLNEALETVSGQGEKP